MEQTSEFQYHIDSVFNKRKVFGSERIFGRGWLSVGGENMAKDYLLKLNLKPGSKVLDAGCGTGGCSFLMARYYGLNVHGVDLSKSVIEIAKERLSREDEDVKDKIHFEIADIAKAEFQDDTYDAIYCRSVIVFVADKEGLFTKMHRWLKPGGTLFFTDYCGGEDGQHSKICLDLVKMRGYQLRPLKDYIQMIRKAGFKDDEVTEATGDFAGKISRDLKYFESRENAFVKDFSKQECDDLVKVWKDLIEIFSSREIVYAVVHARK